MSKKMKAFLAVVGGLAVVGALAGVMYFKGRYNAYQVALTTDPNAKFVW